MEKRIIDKLDTLNLKHTNLLLDKNINLSLDYFTMKRIERSINKKTGYYNKNNLLTQKINDILGGIVMKRKIALVLSVVTICGLGGGVYANAKTTPVAYVSLDINPSVEFGVNSFDEVVYAEAYNTDGEKVLEGTNLVDSDVDDAVSTVITNAITDGYIKEDGTSAIEITTSTDKEKMADELEESLKEAADKTLENNNVEAAVETENVALARRDEARQFGITPGKLNLIQKLQELDSTIKVEDYKASFIKDIQKKAKELRKMNKDNEKTTYGISTDTNTNTDTNSGVITKENTDNSTNNGNVNKEEKSNSNGKKEDSSITNDKEKGIIAKPDTQNNNNGKSNSENKNITKEKNK